MSQKYEIEIEETLSKVVEIEANSLEEALDIVQKRYEKEEYILDYNDYLVVDIRPYDDLDIKDKENNKTSEKKNKSKDYIRFIEHKVSSQEIDKIQRNENTLEMEV